MQGRIWWRAVAAMLVMTCAFALAACGGDDENGTDQAAEEQPPATETEPAEEPEEVVGEGDTRAGEQLFTDNCSTCHGEQGEGGSGAPTLQREDLAEDRERVVDQVTQGGGGMPPFRDQLSNEEINDVATYVSEVLARR
jgi:mono/diheme cytochrome c family protein